MVLIVITSVVFYSIAFVVFNEKSSPSADEVKRAEPWLVCLALSGGDKKSCLHLTGPLVLNQPTFTAVCVLLAVRWKLG